MSYLLANYGLRFEIDMTPFAATRNYVPLCDGFDNVTLSMNEKANEYFFLCGKGFGSEEVTAIHPQISFTGVRKVGDAAQDYIFGNILNLMEARKTNLRVYKPLADGSYQRSTIKATMANVSSFGGATTDGSSVSVDFYFNGRPVVETVAAATLTVTSIAGAATGFTKLTVAPEYADPNTKYVYKWGDTAPTATVGSILTDWNDFTNGADYEIANGKKVTVAMVNTSTYAVVSSGNATVVAAS